MEIISLSLQDKLESSNFHFGSKKVRVQFSSVQSLSRVWLSATPHEPLHARPPCPSPTPRVYSDSCPSCWWCLFVKQVSISHYGFHIILPRKANTTGHRFFHSTLNFNFALIITEQHLVSWQKIPTISLAARGLSLGEFADGLFEFVCTFNHLYTVMDILLSRYFLWLHILDFENLVLLLKKKKKP